MNPVRKHIDSYLRDKLRGHQSRVDEQDWEKLARRMDRKDLKKRNFLWVISLLLTVAAISAWYRPWETNQDMASERNVISEQKSDDETASNAEISQVTPQEKPGQEIIINRKDDMPAGRNTGLANNIRRRQNFLTPDEEELLHNFPRLSVARIPLSNQKISAEVAQADLLKFDPPIDEHKRNPAKRKLNYRLEIGFSISALQQKVISKPGTNRSFSNVLNGAIENPSQTGISAVVSRGFGNFRLGTGLQYSRVTENYNFNFSIYEVPVIDTDGTIKNYIAITPVDVSGTIYNTHSLISVPLNIQWGKPLGRTGFIAGVAMQGNLVLDRVTRTGTLDPVMLYLKPGYVKKSNFTWTSRFGVFGSYMFRSGWGVEAFAHYGRYGALYNKNETYNIRPQSYGLEIKLLKGF